MNIKAFDKQKVPYEVRNSLHLVLETLETMKQNSRLELSTNLRRDEELGPLVGLRRQ